MKKILLLILLLFPLLAAPQDIVRHRQVLTDSLGALNGGIFEVRDTTLFTKTVGIGDSVNASAILDITSITRGLLVPRMTAAQRVAITSPATGLLVFDIDTGAFFYFVGLWSKLAAGTGVGDMLKTVYDTNNDSVVNNSGGLKTINSQMYEFSTSQWRLRNAADNGFVGLYGEQFWAATYSISDKVDYWGTTTGLFQANSGDNAYVAFKAKDNGVGLVEVARIQGAADPYFQATNLYSLYSGNVGIGTASPGGILGIKDANTYIDRDGGNNLTFTDAVTGTKTLADLVGGTAGDSSFITLQLDTGKAFNNSTIQFVDNTAFQNDVQVDSDFTVNAGLTTLKGTDATSGNYSLRVQDNVASNLFDVRNDGLITGLSGSLTFEIDGRMDLRSVTANSTIIGEGAGSSSMTGLRNAFYGSLSGGAITTGNNNVYFGYGSGANNTTNDGHVYIGYLSGNRVDGTGKNVAIGFKALYGAAASTANGNIAIGEDALLSVTSAFGNIAIGNTSGDAITDGLGNILTGFQAGSGITTGDKNAAYGYRALPGISTNDFNSIFGCDAFVNLTSGANNSGLGYKLGDNVTSGSNNVFIGYFSAAAAGARTGVNNNTFVGSLTGRAIITNSTGNVFLGYQAGSDETGSDKLFIDNQDRGSEADNRAEALIYGEFDATPASQILATSGSFGIGTITPSEKLEVNGNILCDTLFSEAINIYSVSDTIDSAAISILNGTPIQIVAAPGAGKAIEVISVSNRMIFNSIAWDANTQLRIITNTANKEQFLDIRTLPSTVSRILRGASVTVSNTTDLQIIENKALMIDVGVGNPANGNSKFIYYVTYRIITL